MPLHYAAHRDYAQTIGVLLAEGADAATGYADVIFITINVD